MFKKLILLSSMFLLGVFFSIASGFVFAQDVEGVNVTPDGDLIGNASSTELSAVEIIDQRNDYLERELSICSTQRSWLIKKSIPYAYFVK